MRFLARFKKLTLWNKFAFIGSVVSILSVPLSIGFFVLGSPWLSNSVSDHQKLVTGSASVEILNAKQATFKAAIGFLATKTDHTSEDIEYLNRLLEDVTPEDIERLIDQVPPHVYRRSIERAVASGQLVSTERLTGVSWNGMPIGIRFFEAMDPNLDFTNVDFYSEGGGVEVTRNIDLAPPGTAIHACATHIRTRQQLELIIIRHHKAYDS